MKNLEPVAHLIPEIQDLFESREWNLIKDILQDLRPEDLADSWYRFQDEQKIGIFKLLDPKAVLVLFESLEIQDQKFLLKSLEEKNIAPLLEGIPPSDVAELFHTLPKSVVRRMVSMVRKEDAIKRIELLMKFEPDTAGSLLHPEFIKLHPRMTSRAALSLIHSVARVHQSKHLWALYVTSVNGVLLGSLTLEDLIGSAPDSFLENLMGSVEYFKMTTDMDQEAVASIFAKYDLLSAPVVDQDQKLLGIIIVDEIIDVIKEEATEDIAKMVGSRPDEFQEKSVLRIAWFRSPWLLVTLIGQFLVFAVIRHFEYAITEVIALASFLPLIPAMGGNVGAQSAMIFVRNIAIGQLKGKEKYQAVIRETGIGMILGFVYGALTGGVAYLLYGQDFGVAFCILVSISVWAAMATATVVGAVGPLVLEKIGIDPATAVGPMVTTISDLLSISIYFTLAVTMLLGHS